MSELKPKSGNPWLIALFQLVLHVLIAILMYSWAESDEFAGPLGGYGTLIIYIAVPFILIFVTFMLCLVAEFKASTSVLIIGGLFSWLGVLIFSAYRFFPGTPDYEPAIAATPTYAESPDIRLSDNLKSLACQSSRWREDLQSTEVVFENGDTLAFNFSNPGLVTVIKMLHKAPPDTALAAWLNLTAKACKPFLQPSSLSWLDYALQTRKYGLQKVNGEIIPWMSLEEGYKSVTGSFTKSRGKQFIVYIDQRHCKVN